MPAGAFGTMPNNRLGCSLIGILYYYYLLNHWTMASDTCQLLQWVDIGSVEELKGRKCRRLYAVSGKDLALFCINDTFYLTSAICPHAGGPLDQGDIEDLGNGRYILTCPLHFISFDLKSGVSATGMKVQTFETQVQEGILRAHIPEHVVLKKVFSKNQT